MKTKNAFWPLCAVASLMLTINVQAQTSVLGHTGLSGDYLGWNSGTTIPLEIRHDGNESIEWYTDALHRMGLYPNVNNVVNGYTINQTGYLGLSDQPAFFNGSGPFTKIHLVEAMGSTNPVNYAQELGYRESARTAIAN